MEKHKASRETGFIYRLLEDGREQWGGRFLSHPEMEKESGSICCQHGGTGLLGSPGQALSPWDLGGSPGCGSTACPEPYPQQAGTGRLPASSKVPLHQKLCVGNGKELHSTHGACFLPGVEGSAHRQAGLGVGPRSHAAAALSMFQSRRCNGRRRPCSSGVREFVTCCMSSFLMIFLLCIGSVQVSHGRGQVAPWFCFPSAGAEAGTGRASAALPGQLLFATLLAKRPFASVHILYSILKQAQETQPATPGRSMLSCAKFKPWWMVN